MKKLLYIILATLIILSVNQAKDVSNDKENLENEDNTVEKFSPVQYLFGIGFSGIFFLTHIKTLILRYFLYT